MTEPMPLETRVYRCPFRCGWFREYNVSPEHAYKILWHPLLGYVTEANLARFDIASHLCESYLDAKVRLMNARVQA